MHDLGLDQRRRVDLYVAAAGVEVQHPGDEGPLQPRAQPFEHVEAAARQLYAALEIDDVQALTHVPVGLRLEVEARGCALCAQHQVAAFVLALRHGVIRQVGEHQQQVVQASLFVCGLRFQRANLVAHLAHLLARLLESLRRLLAGTSDVAAHFVAPGFEGVGFLKELAAVGV